MLCGVAQRRLDPTHGELATVVPSEESEINKTAAPSRMPWRDRLLAVQAQIANHIHTPLESLLWTLVRVDPMRGLSREGPQFLPTPCHVLIDRPVGVGSVAPTGPKAFTNSFRLCLTE